jgi:hypothetical protein
MTHLEAVLLIWDNIRIDDNKTENKDYLVTLVETILNSPGTQQVKLAALSQMETAFPILPTILPLGKSKSDLKTWSDMVADHRSTASAASGPPKPSRLLANPTNPFPSAIPKPQHSKTNPPNKLGPSFLGAELRGNAPTPQPPNPQQKDTNAPPELLKAYESYTGMMKAELPKLTPASLEDYGSAWRRVTTETPPIRLTNDHFAPFKLPTKVMIPIQLFAIHLTHHQLQFM